MKKNYIKVTYYNEHAYFLAKTLHKSKYYYDVEIIKDFDTEPVTTYKSGIRMCFSIYDDYSIEELTENEAMLYMI